MQSAVADYGPMTTEHRYYWTAISIELALKAWLSLVGFTDDQMRRTVGHDLAIARSLAEIEGLSFPDAAEPVRHAACGTPLEARWFCPTCQEPVDPEADEDLHYA